MPASRSSATAAATFCERLDAADRLLHMRREFLHAEARARHADLGERLRPAPVDMARIEFDGVFGGARS